MIDKAERTKLLAELDQAAQAVETAHETVRDIKTSLSRAQSALSNAESAYRKIAFKVHEVLPRVPDEIKGEPAG